MILRKISIIALAASIVAPSSLLQAWPQQQLVQQNNDTKTLLLVGAGAFAAGLITLEGIHLYSQHVKNNEEAAAKNAANKAQDNEDALVPHENVAKVIEDLYTDYEERRFTLVEQDLLKFFSQEIPELENFDVAHVEHNCFASGLKSVGYAKFLEGLIKECKAYKAVLQKDANSLDEYVKGLAPLAKKVPSELKTRILQQYYHSASNFEKHYKGAPHEQKNKNVLSCLLNNKMNFYIQHLQQRCDQLARMLQLLTHTDLYNREYAKQVQIDAQLAENQAIKILQTQVGQLTAERISLHDQKDQLLVQKSRLQGQKDTLQQQTDKLQSNLNTVKGRYDQLRTAFETCGGRHDAKYRRVDDLLYAQDFENIFTWFLS